MTRVSFRTPAGEWQRRGGGCVRSRVWRGRYATRLRGRRFARRRRSNADADARREIAKGGWGAGCESKRGEFPADRGIAWRNGLYRPYLAPRG